MKKLICAILAIFMTISNTCAVFANEEVEFYAYTSDTSGFDEYAKDKFSGFLYGHYGYVDDTIELGQGITIFNENDYPKVLYPVWRNDKIIATFIVVNVEGTYSGTFTQRTYILNYLVNISKFDNPIYLISNETGFYAIQENSVYSMNEAVITNKNNLSFKRNILEECKIVDSKESIDYKEISINTRGNPNSTFTNGWYTYSYDSNHSVTNHCYTYCLYNIFRNLGITQFSFNTIRTGILLGLGTANIPDIKSWLTTNNFTYSYAYSGSLSYSSVYDILCTKDNYIMVGLSYVGTGNDHFMAMYGCSNITGITTYSLWDPESHELEPTSKGLVTMDGDTKLVVNADKVTLRWDEGYIGYFRH